MIKRVWERIYADFLMPSRLKDYEAILQEALQRQYNICSIEQFWDNYQAGKYSNHSKYLILRHDIDTGVSTAKEMFAIERRLGVYASYYFRLSTLDIYLMNVLHDYGSEASYHYEEIATYAKTNHITDPKEIYSKLKEIQELFAKNLEKLRSVTGLPMKIVASHGDFVNRYLGIPNHEMLINIEFRNKCGIVLEVYDEKMMKLVTSRHSDAIYPDLWKPNSPLEAIQRGSKVVYLLTHPRHWRVNIKENFIDDVNRFIEGISYKRN
jgi:hypothetical protein